MTCRRNPRTPLRRTAELATGVFLILSAAVVGPLPGPGGTILFAGGLVLLLRNSARVRRGFVKAKRRYPRVEKLLDRGLQRASAKRRRDRDNAREKPLAPHAAR